MTYRKRSKNGGDDETGVYMREGTTSKVMAADRPYGEFYDFSASVRNILDTTTYMYINVCAHIHPLLEAAAPTVFMVWLLSWL
jgi:hypothetical protein